MSRNFSQYDPNQSKQKLSFEEWLERHDVPEQFARSRYDNYCTSWESKFGITKDAHTSALGN